MIEITSGTLEERIIKLLQRTYPITIRDIKIKLNTSKDIVHRVLKNVTNKRYC